MCGAVVADLQGPSGNSGCSSVAPGTADAEATAFEGQVQKRHFHIVG